MTREIDRSHLARLRQCWKDRAPGPPRPAQTMHQKEAGTFAVTNEVQGHRLFLSRLAQPRKGRSTEPCSPQATHWSVFGSDLSSGRERCIVRSLQGAPISQSLSAPASGNGDESALGTVLPAGAGRLQSDLTPTQHFCFQRNLGVQKGKAGQDLIETRLWPENVLSRCLRSPLGDIRAAACCHGECRQ